MAEMQGMSAGVGGTLSPSGEGWVKESEGKRLKILGLVGGLLY